MGKWDDDIPLQPVGSVQPTTVAALFERLGIADAPESSKVAAIRAWLHNNTPSPLMDHSLRRKGYARLLDERSSASA